MKEHLAGVDKELKARNEKQIDLEKEINTLQKNNNKSLQVTDKLKLVLCKMKQDEISFSKQLKELSDKTKVMSLECQNLYERLKSNS